MKCTLYQILGVEKDATAEAIASAYRARLEVIQAAPGSDAAAMTLLREIYQVLSNAQQRAAYDASLVAPVPSGVARRGRAVPIDDDESDGAWMKWALGGAVVAVALGALSNGSFAYVIEHLDESRMVLNIGVAGQRLARKRR